MKKKFLSLFFIIFILNINHSLSSEKTVFIDIDFVLNNSYLGKSIYQELEKINKNNIKKLELKEENIKKKKDMINKTKNITSKEKLEKDIILFNQELEVYRVEKDKIFDQFKKKSNKIWKIF